MKNAKNAIKKILDGIGVAHVMQNIFNKISKIGLVVMMLLNDDMSWNLLN